MKRTKPDQATVDTKNKDKLIREILDAQLENVVGGSGICRCRTGGCNK
jgi:hypothetical protein